MINLIKVGIILVILSSSVFADTGINAKLVQSLYGGWGDAGQIIVDNKLTNGGENSLNLIWRDNVVSSDVAFWAVSRGIENSDFVTISYDLYIDDIAGNPSLIIYLGENDLDRWSFTHHLSNMPKKKWIRFSHKLSDLDFVGFGNNKKEKNTITSFHIEPDGKDSYENIYLDNIVLTSSGGSTVNMLSVDSIKPAYSDPITKKYVLNDSSAYMKAFIAADALTWLGGVNAEKIKKFKKLFPSVAFSTGGYVNADVGGELNQFLKFLGVPSMGENQDAWDFNTDITRAQAWCVRFDGESNNITPNKYDTGHSACFNHPEYIDMQKRRIDAVVSAGYTRYTFIDYIMPYFGGRWGYSPSDIIAYRSALNGTDGGLLLKADGGGTVKKIYFWDYYMDYTGIKLNPSDVGINSWNEYTPVSNEDLAWNGKKEDRRNFNLFISLYHYSWLKFLDTIGNYYSEQSNGLGKIWIIPNPEDIYTGVDYIYAGRLANLGGNLCEYFGNPGFLEAIYRSGRYLSSDYKKTNTLLGPVLETNAGGHGTPYYDPWVSYAVAYDLYAAMNATVTKNDFLQNQSFEEQTDPKNTYAYDRFRDVAVKQIAFDNYKSDKLQYKKSEIAVMQQRNMNRLRSSIFHSLEATPHIWEGSASIALSALGYSYDQIDTISYSPVEEYNTLFLGVSDLPNTTVKRLQSWLLSNKKNTIIMSANQPYSRADAVHYTLWHNSEFFIIDNPDYGKDFNLSAPTFNENNISKKADKVDRIFSKFFKIGEIVNIAGGYYKVDSGKTLLSVGGLPIVSQRDYGNGGSVIYLHYRAGEPSNLELDKKIFAALAEEYGSRSQFDNNKEIYTHKYVLGMGGYSVVLWARPTLDAWNFIYDGNLKQRLADLSPNFSAITHVLLDKSGDYIVYDLVSDQKEYQKTNGNRITLNLKDNTCAVYYVLPKNSAGEEKILKLKESRLREIIEGKDIIRP